MRCFNYLKVVAFKGSAEAIPNLMGGHIDLVTTAAGNVAGHAPKRLTPQQIAFWEGVLRKATEAPEWKEDLDRNVWSNVFLGSAQFAKELDKDYADMKSVLVDSPGMRGQPQCPPQRKNASGSECRAQSLTAWRDGKPQKNSRLPPMRRKIER